MSRFGVVLLRVAAGVVALLIAGNAALASTGCTAIQTGAALNLPFLIGGPNPAVDRNIAAVAFDAGDVITLTADGVNAPGLGNNQSLTLTVGAVTRDFSRPPNGPNTAGVVLTITALGTETTAASHLGAYSADAPGVITVSCLTAQQAAALNKNNNLAKMMQAGKLAAQASGAAISGAIGAAVNEAFDDICSAFTPLPDGVRVNVNGLSDRDPACFDDNNRSGATSRFAAETFEATSYARKPGTSASDVFRSFDKKTTAKRMQQDWRVWIDVRGTNWNTTGSAIDFRGDQVNVLAGVTRKFSRDFIAGVFVGYENFRFTSQALSGRLRGDGGTLGTYLGWRIANGVRFDAGLAYSLIGYSVAADQGLATAVSGSLTGKRWLITTGLTGDYVWNAYTFEPSARIYWLTERQDLFIDTLGNLNGAHSFSTGRASLGEKVIFPATVFTGKFAVAPYVGLYGDYYFTADDADAALTQNGLTSVVLRGTSGRAIAGINGKTAGGTQMMLGGEYGGIGGNARIWTYRARLGVPF